MPSVVGLGDLAGEVVSGFETYPEYEVYRIGVGLKDTAQTKGMKKQDSVELYEQNPPATKRFFKNIQDEVIFVCTGAEPESGAVLRILETIKDKKITVIYLRKDLDLVSQKEVLQDRVAFGILQNYARSGLFERIVLIDMNQIDEILGDVPVSEYAERQSQLVASTYHMIQVFQHSQPIMGNMLPSESTNRISTLGLSEIGESDDKWFFELNKSFEVYYLYAVNENLLNQDKRLLNKIKTQIKERAQENTKTMFGIFPTDYDQNYVFCLANTKIVQGEKN